MEKIGPTTVVDGMGPALNIKQETQIVSEKNGGEKRRPEDNSTGIFKDRKIIVLVCCL